MHKFDLVGNFSTFDARFSCDYLIHFAKKMRYDGIRVGLSPPLAWSLTPSNPLITDTQKSRGDIYPPL